MTKNKKPDDYMDKLVEKKDDMPQLTESIASEASLRPLVAFMRKECCFACLLNNETEQGDAKEKIALKGTELLRGIFKKIVENKCGPIPKAWHEMHKKND